MPLTRNLIIILAVSAICFSCKKEASNQSDRKAVVATIDMRGDSMARYAGYDTIEGPAVRMKVNHLGRLDEVFNDSNKRHWECAEPIGIKPISNLRSHWRLRRPLVKVVSCEYYVVEPLNFSHPYLVPEAAALLSDIGRRFRDTLTARGGGDYRIRVTSVLRTPAHVRKLRRRNRNAVDSSVHQLGTTFDISYSAFAPGSCGPYRSANDLKGVLAEVLYAMRNEGRCLVKYEKKQPCFHISTITNSKK